MKSRTYLIVITIFIALTLQACGPMTLRMKQIPQLKGASPLAGIKPLTFVINDFGDKRVHKDAVGFHQGRKIVIDQKVTDIMVQAIAAELKRNGHKVLEPKDMDKADVVIDGIVGECWFESREHFWTVKKMCTVKAHIAVTRALTSDIVLSKSYSGLYEYQTESHPIFSTTSPSEVTTVTTGAIRDALNEAFLNMVKDFTTDPEFLDVLQQLEKEV